MISMLCVMVTYGHKKKTQLCKIHYLACDKKENANFAMASLLVVTSILNPNFRPHAVQYELIRKPIQILVNLIVVILSLKFDAVNLKIVYVYCLCNKVFCTHFAQLHEWPSLFFKSGVRLTYIM